MGSRVAWVLPPLRLGTGTRRGADQERRLASRRKVVGSSHLPAFDAALLGVVMEVCLRSVRGWGEFAAVQVRIDDLDRLALRRRGVPAATLSASLRFPFGQVRCWIA